MFVAVSWSLIRAIIVLPVNVLFVVPAVIVWASADSGLAIRLAAFDQWQFWLALAVGAKGAVLMGWTVALFTQFGNGTPAPWDPPRDLVIRGPYRYVRNPMISGVLQFLFAEALILQSWPLGAWTLIFFIANAIYFPLSEEKGLERRFGDAYRDYKANVPRWLPRLRPWHDS